MSKLLFGLLFLLNASSVFAQNLSGTYKGVLSHDRLGQDQLAKLELIYSRAEAGKFHLRAILTFQFGGFDSTEYVSYHYDDVIWNLLTGELTFSQPDQEVQFVSAKIQNGVISGEILASEGRVGTIELSQKGGIKPKLPLIETLGGEYKGACGKTPSVLQLHTYRSTSDTTRLTSPFAAYEAKGQVGMYDPEYCRPTKSKMCTHSKIKSASYNFFSGDLILDGYPYGFSCSVSAGKIKCNDCVYSRVSNEMERPRLSPNKYQEDPIEPIRKALKANLNAGLKGQYVGYVFHENLNVFQKIRIEISTYNRATQSGTALVISTVASIQFGDGDEIIHYRFNPLDYPNPILEKRFVLARAEADVDVLLGVEGVEGGIIHGSWNSHIFGRVGSFVATKNGDLPKLSKSRLMGPVSSGYSQVGGDDIADILVAKGSSPIGSDNPFDPLKLNGYVWRKSNIVEKLGIQGGSYDFYTGRIALIYGEERVMSGNLLAGRNAFLRRLGGGFGTLIQPFELKEFKKVDFGIGIKPK